MQFYKMKELLLLFCLSILSLCEGSGSDRVRLQDVTAITLYAGKMTRGRRVDPVPQIKCVGWCPISEPRTASCVNRGFDGYDVQWECKAELDGGYEFDNVDVLCEGYDYSNDPYILRGSCGLEYTLRGSSKTKQSPHNYKDVQEKPSGLKNLIPFIAGLLLIWALYKTCISPAMNDTRHDRSSTNDDYPDDGSGPRMGWNIPGFGGGFGGGLGGGGYTGGTGSYSDASCGAGTRRQGGNGGAGFWTGLATGGMMGYMFGNRNTGPTYQQPMYSQPSSGFFGSGSSYGGSSSYSSGDTHTSTGFGGTRRR